MMHKNSKTGQRKVSPPGPTYMNGDQIANYLKELRSNRPARPTGSRPYPGKSTTSTTTASIQDDLPPRASSAFSMHRPSEEPVEEQPRAGSSLSHRRTTSHVPQSGTTERPLAQGPRSMSVRKNVFPAQVFSRSVPITSSPAPSYRENGHRLQEKEEARSLRDALQGVNLEDDETRIHSAAQNEATELVWMHQNPGMANKNPYAPYYNPDSSRGGPSPARRSSDFSSKKWRHSVGSSGSSSNPSSPEFTMDSSKRRSSRAGNLKKNLKVNFALPDDPPEKPASKPRTVSGDSSKGVFNNPNDHIYEEPNQFSKEAADERPFFSRSASSALRNEPRNALPRTPKPLPWLRDRNSNGSVRDKISKFDIHKNPPTQSRNAGYTRNESTPPPAPSTTEDEIPTKDGIEIRSDDIRAATSKRLKDRSENLPKPSAVSDRVGRPIVSFDPKWQPANQPKSAAPPLPIIEIAAPTIEVTPSIEVSAPPPIPVINIPDIKEPTISEYSSSTKQESRPMRQAPAAANRPANPRPLARQPSEPQSRWTTPYSRSGVPTASCEACSLGISGKIVTAGGCRFHPECFVCFHCQTHLECVAFYEEPAASRDERLASSPDEDRVPRFYCHLDFHELYSPRCKSCKTPIEGEVVVACGAEWHVGHFFCAECGDPFNSTTPFVEKEGFAWCLNCHSRRTASRCQGCKQHVLDDVVVNAIGGQWHERCFACHECGEGFGPEGRFFVREGEPKRTAKGRIIGGPVQLAVCERCEGIRLKAPGMC
ncbi:hypothetical protein N7466_004950 [Penicillium verhagenii]|uniref:uncharacterized protein n=1 Tax=Penicillium verhagenii TaxID=1562060 RepID=UPI002544EF62|nr:uncharacterized protein N7466_004950 [Penicillium verhagenii]KAJ5935403.1 hypothetical protein N7466_004950 [Penicillium verhagenii]